ncbi:MAG: prepilin-type N-terminal cleavage/methylation domain-containing protein [Phycisphaerales bacterium]
MSAATLAFHPRRGTAAVRGFTLLELLIVVGIIALLAGIVLAVSAAVLRRSEVRSMEAAMALLDQAVGEFEKARDQKITFKRTSDAAGTWDINEQAITAPYLIVPTLYVIGQNERSRGILQRIDPDLLRQDQTTTVPSTAVVPLPRLEMVDPWGFRLAVVFPGRPWVQGDSGVRDADGTVRTNDENLLGVCRDRRIAFVSGGPDGNLATRDDNVYSYELLPPT